MGAASETTYAARTPPRSLSSPRPWRGRPPWRRTSRLFGGEGTISQRNFKQSDWAGIRHKKTHGVMGDRQTDCHCKTQPGNPQPGREAYKALRESSALRALP